MNEQLASILYGTNRNTRDSGELFQLTKYKLSFPLKTTLKKIQVKASKNKRHLKLNNLKTKKK